MGFYHESAGGHPTANSAQEEIRAKKKARGDIPESQSPTFDSVSGKKIGADSIQEGISAQAGWLVTSEEIFAGIPM